MERHTFKTGQETQHLNEMLKIAYCGKAEMSIVIQVLSAFGLAPYRLFGVITGNQSTALFRVLRFTTYFEQTSDRCFCNMFVSKQREVGLGEMHEPENRKRVR